ncbi:poly(A) RNA polymerase, mitochondrial [Halyomorpha halys]|uniref:poly(A) RNA polymerase, mitochondrial n=1 Tax=Halyomorpha halys TaxID=286706 RepID=UPI0006D4D5F5|nr:poly(A) RNA polymerase, mitochondrial-like [Halyomorpha halys]
MGIFLKIKPGFVYCYRKNIVKHIANIAFENVIYSSNNFSKNVYCTNLSGKDRNGDIKTAQFVRFDDMIEKGRKAAQRSYVVQVNSENSCLELHDYCQSICAVENMYYYQVKENHFVLVEFTNAEAVQKLNFNSNNQAVVSPFIWFRTGKKKKLISSPVNVSSHFNVAQAPTEHEIIEWMSVAQSLLNEMEILYQSTKLSELGFKLRMICARQVEMILSGLFPNIRAFPFGSTVNSFGKEGCDLDVVLHYNFSQENSDDLRLVYQSKINGISSRGQTQRQMELLGDLLQVYVPGVTGVKRILGARVPIIKYSHDYTGVDIDISLTNLGAMYMSELLYVFAHLDPAAQRLVFAVKAWAKVVCLTNPTPGRWITNFSLTLLVLFYLQAERRLPSVDELFKLAGPNDTRYAEEINCSFIRDPTNVRLDLDHSKTMEKLLLGFFQFYQNFDFNSKAISLCSGKIINKPDYSPIYIVNPLERSLNVSKNVSLEEVERLRIETRNAAWILETNSRLVDIFRSSPESLLSNKRKYISRMVKVKDLFQT